MLLIFIKPRYFPNIFDILKLNNEKDTHLLQFGINGNDATTAECRNFCNIKSRNPSMIFLLSTT